MKIVLSEKNTFVLKFERGEEVVSLLDQFCRKEKITSAFFHGLGACSYLKLAYYNLETKKYQEQEFSQDLEIANITGNIAVFENDQVVHMHGSFADKTMKAFGGHVVSMKIAGTCELLLTKFSQPMTRKFDQQTGLKLLD